MPSLTSPLSPAARTEALRRLGAEHRAVLDPLAVGVRPAQPQAERPGERGLDRAGVGAGVAGGVTVGERESAQVFAYDPATDQWTTLPALPGPRQSPVADVIGDALVVATGATTAGPTDSTFVSR